MGFGGVLESAVAYVRLRRRRRAIEAALRRLTRLEAERLELQKLADLWDTDPPADTTRREPGPTAAASPEPRG